MPRANVYIRKENEDAWNASNKSDWINEQLQKMSPIVGMTIDTDARMTLTPVIGMGDKLKKVQTDKGVEFCSHNQVKGFCKKGCRWNA